MKPYLWSGILVAACGGAQFSGSSDDGDLGPGGGQNLPDGGSGTNAAGQGGDGRAGSDFGRGGEGPDDASAGSGGAAHSGDGAGGAGYGGGDPEPTERPPATCAGWRERGVTTDGTQTIDPDADGPMRPFPVFCYDMAGAAKAFLELAHTEGTGWPGMNTGTSKEPGCSCGAAVVVAFTKVLLRTGDLRLLGGDSTFRTNGSGCPDTCWAPFMSYGEARDCIGAGSTAGKFEIDLRGTPFHIREGAAFVTNGWTPIGDVMVSADRKRATVIGGGFCGGYGPDGNELPLAQDMD